MLMTRAIIALGFAGAMAAAAPAPALAQGVYFGVPGAGVEIGPPAHRHYYRDYDSYGYERHHFRGGCRTVTIERDDGSVRTIRRCD